MLENALTYKKNVFFCGPMNRNLLKRLNKCSIDEMFRIIHIDCPVLQNVECVVLYGVLRIA